MAVTPLLALCELHCERDGRVLFEGLNFQLQAGQVVELRGPNGAGKSTLLRCVAGLYPDFDGTCEAAEFLYLGHRSGLCAPLTAAENLRWYQSLVAAGDADAVRAALVRVGLAGYDDQPSASLSAGQQRRLALARLLLGSRPLWLLDEPLTALDDAGAELLRELIESHTSGGGAVLAATHAALGLSGAGTLRLGG